ncbi:hypothetical protein AGMMS49940_18760 [Spirochaetia bacterium]|nr:hypothetical protein AGMMS49940_18760 [Spirochaetia bacterium]
MKNFFKLFGVIALAAVIGIGLAGCDGGGGGGTTTTYTAVQAGGISGSADSTAISFTFSPAVDGLTDGDITVANGPGVVVTGTLTGSGTNWSLALTSVTTPGNVTVSISKPGIESGSKTVTVYKEGATADTTYTATQVGGTAGTTTSTNISFTFDAAVTGLTASEITVNGAAAKSGGAPVSSSGGTIWTLPITVSAEGNATVSINRTGIENGNKTVAVYKAGGGGGSGLTITGIPSEYNGKWAIGEIETEDDEIYAAISVSDAYVTSGQISGGTVTLKLYTDEGDGPIFTGSGEFSGEISIQPAELTSSSGSWMDTELAWGTFTATLTNGIGSGTFVLQE